MTQNPLAHKANTGWEGPAIATLEHSMHRDKGDKTRGQSLDRFYEKTRGQLLAAAQSVATEPTPVIRILTGFYIEHAGAAETDGILAAAQMVYFFKLAGIDCCITTDKHCENICRAALAEVGCLDKIEVIQDDAPETSASHAIKWEKDGVSHAIAIERPGPSLSDDLSYNMRGEALSHYTPLHLLFKSGVWKKIGVIDRGNELGSGSLPAEIIADDISNGSKIACKTGADFLLVSRVSNWAANALTAAIAILGKDEWTAHLRTALDTNLQRRILVKMVKAGSVDGITHIGNPRSPTVDALGLDIHNSMTQSFLAAVTHATNGRKLLDNPSSLQATRPPHFSLDGGAKAAVA